MEIPPVALYTWTCRALASPARQHDWQSRHCHTPRSDMLITVKAPRWSSSQSSFPYWAKSLCAGISLIDFKPEFPWGSSITTPSSFVDSDTENGRECCDSDLSFKSVVGELEPRKTLLPISFNIQITSQLNSYLHTQQRVTMKTCTLFATLILAVSQCYVVYGTTTKFKRNCEAFRCSQPRQKISLNVHRLTLSPPSLKRGASAL